MPDTLNPDTLDPDDTTALHEALKQIADRLMDQAQADGLQAIITLARPNTAGDLVTVRVTHASPAFCASTAKSIADHPDVAPHFDALRLAGLLDNLNTPQDGKD